MLQFVLRSASFWKPFKDPSSRSLINIQKSVSSPVTKTEPSGTAIKAETFFKAGKSLISKFGKFNKSVIK